MMIWSLEKVGMDWNELCVAVSLFVKLDGALGAFSGASLHKSYALAAKL